MEQGKLVAVAIRKKSHAPMVEIPQAEITTETGVVGDFRGTPGPRQVTVLSVEAWNATCEGIGKEIPWTVRRANLLIAGLNLANTMGSRLRIGDVILKITGETEPCQRMDDQVAGLCQALSPHWRGGVCCQVVSGGAVEPGHVVALESLETPS